MARSGSTAEHSAVHSIRDECDAAEVALFHKQSAEATQLDCHVVSTTGNRQSDGSMIERLNSKAGQTEDESVPPWKVNNRRCNSPPRYCVLDRQLACVLADSRIHPVLLTMEGGNCDANSLANLGQQSRFRNDPRS